PMASALAMRSTHPPGRAEHAAAAGMATTIVTNSAAPASSSVLGRRWAMVVRVLVSYRNELPRSPRIRRVIQRAYCSGSGRSTPSRSAIACRSATLSLGSARSDGPPGAACTIAKVTVHTTSSTSRACPRRRRRNAAIVAALPGAHGEALAVPQGIADAERGEPFQPRRDGLDLARVEQDEDRGILHLHALEGVVDRPSLRRVER